MRTETTPEIAAVTPVPALTRAVQYKLIETPESYSKLIRGNPDPPADNQVLGFCQREWPAPVKQEGRPGGTGSSLSESAAV
jgi:hypothetical protein